MLETVLQANYGTTKEALIQRADQEIQNYLQKRLAPLPTPSVINEPATAHVPATPSSTQSRDSIHIESSQRGTYSDASMYIPQVATGATRRQRFRHPPEQSRVDAARAALTLLARGVKREVEKSLDQMLQDGFDEMRNERVQGRKPTKQERGTSSSSRVQELEKELELERMRVKHEEDDEDSGFADMVAQFALETKDAPMEIAD